MLIDATCHSCDRRVLMPFSISESILEQYFTHVESLDSYLTHILNPASDLDVELMGHTFHPRVQDSKEYSSLINTTLVATRNRENYEWVFKAYQPPAEMNMLHVCKL